MILRGKKKSALVSTLIITIFSVANHYVILFHGSPLFPSEFANAKTALNVLSSYKIMIDRQIVDVVIMLLTELYLIQNLQEDSERKSIRTALLLMVSAVLSFALLVSPVALKERYLSSWKIEISIDGFIHCAAANFVKIQHPIRTPEGYDSKQITMPETESRLIPEQKPDIIVVINESFCDLGIYSDIESDIDYLDGFKGIENASYGYAFSPEIGGGTNNTEFEVLTSDSMFLLNSFAPFNYLKLNEKNSTHLSYLKTLGYESYAVHAKTGVNYNRGNAYPALAFDHVFLEENCIFDINYYGNRPWTGTNMTRCCLCSTKILNSPSSYTF